MASQQPGNTHLKPISPASGVSNSSLGFANSGASNVPSERALDTTRTSVQWPARTFRDLEQRRPPSQSGLEVVKIVKPHSKTAIGQVVQKLRINSMMDIFELHFQMEKEGKGWISVEGARLRYKAAQAWIKNVLSNEFHDHCWISVGPTVGTVRLGLHRAKKGKQEIVAGQVNIGSVKVLNIHGIKVKTVKTTRKEIAAPSTSISGKSINLLLRETEKRLVCLEPLPSSMSGSRFFSPVVPACSSSISPMQPSDYQLYLRRQAVVNVNRGRLQIDFDLVPCIPSKPLDRVVLDMSGLLTIKDTDSKTMEALLPQIKRSLLGARVRCAYIPGAKTDGGREKATILSQKDIGHGRAFRVRDIIMPGPDTAFDLDGTRHWTYEYFAKMLPDTKKLNTALPLVKDDTGALIPIELVITDGPQPLLRFGHVNEAIRASIRQYMELEGATEMFDFSKSLVEGFLTAFNNEGEEPRAALEARGRARFTQSADSGLAKKAVLDRPREAANRIAAPHNMLDARISMLFVEDIPGQASNHGLVNGAGHGLQSLSSEVVYPYNIRTAKQIAENTDLEEVGANSDLLFAIVENRAHSKTYTSSIISQLHRLADRQIGIPLVCTTTQHLASVMKGPLDPFSKRFPASLRAKINYKLGGMNFETSLQPVVRGTGLMIAGGHIAHRAVKEKKGLPSISSVVATRDDSCSQYLGSVCIHNSTVSERNSHGRYSTRLQTSLSDLQMMMKERFDKCDDPPLKVLFFRDSMRFDEAIADFKSECEMIKLAYKESFPNLQYSPKITYVVVNKSIEIKMIPTASIKPTAVPLFNYVIADEANAKYRHYVIENEIGWSEEYLKTLTRHINESSQIATQVDRIAKSLPLKLAKKLSDRTWDYYKDYSNDPSFERTGKSDQTTHDDEIPMKQITTCDVVRHLGIDKTDARALPWKKSLDEYMFYL